MHQEFGWPHRLLGLLVPVFYMKSSPSGPLPCFNLGITKIRVRTSDGQQYPFQVLYTFQVPRMCAVGQRVLLTTNGPNSFIFVLFPLHSLHFSFRLSLCVKLFNLCSGSQAPDQDWWYWLLSRILFFALPNIIWRSGCWFLARPGNNDGHQRIIFSASSNLPKVNPAHFMFPKCYSRAEGIPNQYWARAIFYYYYHDYH